KEAARGCGGRGLWIFNRFSAGNRCRKRDSAKTLLLMLIDVAVTAFSWIILTRGGPLFKTTVQDVSVQTTVQTTVSNACISHALASAARAASFMTVYPERIR